MEMDGIFDTVENDAEVAANANAGANAQGDVADDSENEGTIDPITPAEGRLFGDRPMRALGGGCWVATPVYFD
jgi:hypothetical protein